MTSVVGMVVTIQTNLETTNAPTQPVVTEQNLEKTFLVFPEDDVRRACLSVKMLMLDGCHILIFPTNLTYSSKSSSSILFCTFLC